MRIGVDARCLMEGRRSGVEEYTAQLLHHLIENDTGNEYVLFLNSFGPMHTGLTWVQEYENVSIKRTYYPNKVLNLLIWYFGWPRIDRILGGVDVFFAPNINFISLSKRTKFLLTMHDLSFELYPQTFSWKRRLWHMFINPKKLCRRADSILTVSESTKNDLKRTYNVPAEKIHVIYSGLSEYFNSVNRNSMKLIEVKEKYQLPYRFILYLGTFEPRKNIIAIVDAFNALKKQGKTYEEYHLVLAGSPGWKGGDLQESINRSRYNDQIHVIGYVDDEDKPALYSLASVFVYPSLYEGFGFPVVESMRCGIPVITSDSSSLNEVTDTHAIHVDPFRPDEIRRALEQLLGNKPLYIGLSHEGKKRSTLFQWPRTAKKVQEIIDTL